MEHELEKMALKHQDDIREVKCQFKEVLAEAEQKHMQLTMGMERGYNFHKVFSIICFHLCARFFLPEMKITKIEMGSEVTEMF